MTRQRGFNYRRVMRAVRPEVAAKLEADKKRPPEIGSAGVEGIDPTDTSSETSTRQTATPAVNPIHGATNA